LDASSARASAITLKNSKVSARPTADDALKQELARASASRLNISALQASDKKSGKSANSVQRQNFWRNGRVDQIVQSEEVEKSKIDPNKLTIQEKFALWQKKNR
jgi:hypothetical protein